MFVLGAGAYARGVHWVFVHPPPHLEKSSTQKCPKDERKFCPDMSSKKNVHVPLRYNKVKTKKVGKKEDISKRKGIKLKIKKDDSRLLQIEIIKYIVSCLFTIIVVLDINNQVILAFIFVFIVYLYSLYLTFLNDYSAFDKLRQRHSIYTLGIATLEFEIINISSAAKESKRIACNLPFENQLFGYIHYCTEININLLLNTCNFHCKFRFIFSLNLPENMQNVHFREAKFQNFPGEHAPDPPSILALLALNPIFAGLTMNCFCWLCYYQWVILSIILHILITQKDVSFFQ